MPEHAPEETTVARIHLAGCPPGPVLQPLDGDEALAARHFPGWETALAPRGGFNLDSGLAVVEDDGRPALEWTSPRERALVAGSAGWRDYRIVAALKPLAAEANPHDDNTHCREALVGDDRPVAHQDRKTHV